MFSFLSFRGRLRRRSYFFLNLLVSLPLYFLSLIIDETAPPTAFVLLLLLFVISIGQSIKRFHDMNLSGWLTLLLVVPILNVLLSIGLTFVDGSHGPNRFGADAKGRAAWAPTQTAATQSWTAAETAD
ncbi:DUF805 domain-containing protein [Hymenobacter koreensis]|uniref:DUF805 domain-containing protein n=1 Tax=Hymenobacter koreensis TaxID=1084523 RepID=A0ABP8IUE8_9BACT